MLFTIGTIIGLVGAFLAFRAIQPRMRRSKDYDAGTVSDAWLQQQRGQSNNPDR